MDNCTNSNHYQNSVSGHQYELKCLNDSNKGSVKRRDSLQVGVALQDNGETFSEHSNYR